MTEIVTTPNPADQRTKPATVGFMLGVLGLGMIFLAGCFMVGIMILQFAVDSSNNTRNAVADQLVFLALLYGFAFGCAGGGAFALVKAVRKLLAS